MTRVDQIPAVFWSQYQGPHILEHLNDIRKEQAAHREAMLQNKKDCASRQDIEGARFFKDEAAEAMKAYRGACIAIGQINPGWLGDCLWLAPEDMPSEIIPYVYRACGLAYVRPEEQGA